VDSTIQSAEEWLETMGRKRVEESGGDDGEAGTHPSGAEKV